jgi:hypothetical protein
MPEDLNLLLHVSSTNFLTGIRFDVHAELLCYDIVIKVKYV